jgi:hypothetical protein
MEAPFLLPALAEQHTEEPTGQQAPNELLSHCKRNEKAPIDQLQDQSEILQQLTPEMKTCLQGFWSSIPVPGLSTYQTPVLPGSGLELWPIQPVAVQRDTTYPLYLQLSEVENTGAALSTQPIGHNHNSTNTGQTVDLACGVVQRPSVQADPTITQQKDLSEPEMMFDIDENTIFWNLPPPM